MLGALAAAMGSLISCSSADECGANPDNYNDLYNGDRCQLEVDAPGGIENSANLLQLTPAELDVPGEADLLITGKVDGTVADGYLVELRIKGALPKADPFIDPTKILENDACTAAFELSPASELDVCTKVSPSVLRCVFDAVGQLGVTVSTRRTQPITGCSVVAQSGSAIDGTKLEVIYPLETLSLEARLPATFGPCGDAATPCVVPPALPQGFCTAAPACEGVVQEVELYFASERGGQQVGSGQDITVSLTSLRQSVGVGQVDFSTSGCPITDSAPSIAIDAAIGESPAVQVCVDGRGGTYELRGTASKGGAVLTDSRFVDFPPVPTQITRRWLAAEHALEVGVLACDGRGIPGLKLTVATEVDGGTSSAIVTTDGVGLALVPLADDPTMTKVTLDTWNATCTYPGE